MEDVLDRFNTGYNKGIGQNSIYSMRNKNPFFDKNNKKNKQWMEDAAFIQTFNAFNVLENIKKFLPGAISDKEGIRVEKAFGNLDSPESEVRWAIKRLREAIEATRKANEANLVEFGGKVPQKKQQATQTSPQPSIKYLGERKKNQKQNIRLIVM
ncbi:hypothetical protein NO2_0408 [Candidatus Termititenax persephonae]|uniref:Uncharacterized protein n=1 Tax=Candidatus Termititenax persephonae TaxID=2218525 RepID=A0A388TFE8_9BACT|nr:hypothetical protein NO2_0408 [Candidatus Termititenax persephonae]